MKIGNAIKHYEKGSGFYKEEEQVAAAPKEIILDEIMQTRLHQTEKVSCSTLGKDCPELKTLDLSVFLPDLIITLFNKGVIPEKHHYQGTHVLHVVCGKIFNDIDFFIEVAEHVSLERTDEVFAEFLKKYPGVELVKYISALEGHLVTLTLNTEPPVDIMLAKSLPFSCVSSADCFRLMRKEDAWVIIAIDEYDLERSLQLFKEGKFEVIPESRTKKIYNGLFRYCKLLQKGLLPIQEKIEGLFCEGFIAQYPHYKVASLKHLKKTIRNFIVTFDETQKQAFLFTLENILIRNEIEGKDKYLDIIHNFLSDFEKKKAVFFYNYWKRGDIPIYIKTQPKRPPRYHLEVEAGKYAYLEATPLVIEKLLYRNQIQEAFELLRSIEDACDPSFLLKILQAGIQHGEQKEAMALLKRQVEKFLLLERQELFCFLEEIPKCSYVFLLEMILKEDWEGYINEIERGKDFKITEQEFLLALVGMPLNLTEDLQEALLMAQDPKWQVIGLKRASLERIIQFIEEGKIPNEARSILEEKMLTALDSVEMAALLPSIEMLDSLPFFVSILERIYEKSEPAFTCLRSMLLSKGPKLLKELIRKNTPESMRAVFAFIEKGQQISPSSLEKAINNGVKQGMVEEAFTLFQRHIGDLYPLGKQRMRALCQQFLNKPYAKLCMYLLDEDRAGYIHALESGIFYKKKEQEHLLSIVGAPLVFKNNIIESLMASDDPSWQEIGFKKASALQILNFLKKNEMPNSATHIIKARFLSMDIPDPELIEKVLKEEMRNAQWKPIIKKAVLLALRENKMHVALKLLEAGKFTFLESLNIGYNEQSKNGCRLCLRCFSELDPNDQERYRERIINYALDHKLIAEILPFLEEHNAPKVYAQIIDGVKVPSMSMIQMCRLLLPNLSNYPKALAKAIVFLNSSIFSKEALSYFWQRVLSFKNISLPERVQLLRSLEAADPDISFFMEAFEENTFQTQKYLELIKTSSHSYLNGARQESLLKLIGQHLSFIEIQLLNLSEEDFLSQIESSDLSVLKSSARDLVLKRFETIFSKSPSSCSSAYLKMKNFLPISYTENLLNALPLQDGRKLIILEAAFELRKKLKVDDIVAFLMQLKVHCQKDPFLEPKVIELIENGVLNQRLNSKEVLYAAISLLTGMHNEDYFRAAGVVMIKALEKKLYDDIAICFEEQKKKLNKIPGGIVLRILEKAPLVLPQDLVLERMLNEPDLAIQRELGLHLFKFLNPSSEAAIKIAFFLLENISKENNANIKCSFLLHCIDCFGKCDSFPLLEKSLNFFLQEGEKGTLSKEQIDQGMKVFFNLKLEECRLHPLADKIIECAVKLKQKGPELELFLVRHWCLFNTNALCLLELNNGFPIGLEFIFDVLDKEYDEICIKIKNASPPNEPILEQYQSILSMIPGTFIIPLDLAKKRDEAKLSLERFIKFLRLIDHPQRFNANEMQFGLLKMAAIVALQNPLLWHPDIDKALDKRWKSPIKTPASMFATSSIIKEYIVACFSEGPVGVQIAQNVLMLAIKNEALTFDILERLVILLKDYTSDPGFNEKVSAACKEGRYVDMIKWLNMQDV